MSNNQQPKPAPQPNNNQNSQIPKKEEFQRGLAQHLKTVQQLAPRPNIQPKPAPQQNNNTNPAKKDT